MVGISDIFQVLLYFHLIENLGLEVGNIEGYHPSKLEHLVIYSLIGD